MKPREATSPKFHVGDRVGVRITRKKGTFEKRFTPNWTEEVFTISSVKSTIQPTYYPGYTRGTSPRDLLRARVAVECTGNLSY